MGLKNFIREFFAYSHISFSVVAFSCVFFISLQSNGSHLAENLTPLLFPSFFTHKMSVYSSYEEDFSILRTMFLNR